MNEEDAINDIMYTLNQYKISYDEWNDIKEIIYAMGDYLRSDRRLLKKWEKSK